jgi:hypothetical protein
MTEATVQKAPVMTGGCQCGALRYALYRTPVSTVCHCRMCQKATGGIFAALAKVALADFAWTRGAPGSFQSSQVAMRDFCPACGTPLTFRFIGGDALEVTTGSLDQPAQAPATRHFGVEARVPWFAALMQGHLPEEATTAANRPPAISRQHPDHDT